VSLRALETAHLPTEETPADIRSGEVCEAGGPSVLQYFPCVFVGLTPVVVSPQDRQVSQADERGEGATHLSGGAENLE